MSRECAGQEVNFSHISWLFSHFYPELGYHSGNISLHNHVGPGHETCETQLRESVFELLELRS
jgi:hypothetical protein